MAKRKLTEKQKQALARGRAKRKKMLAKKRKAPARKKAVRKKVAAKKTSRRVTRKPTVKSRRRVARKKPSRKKSTRRTTRKSTSIEYHIYARKGKTGTRYYLQKIARRPGSKGGWVFRSGKPAGMSAREKANAAAVAKRLIKRLPAGYNIFVNAKKK